MFCRIKYRVQNLPSTIWVQGDACLRWRMIARLVLRHLYVFTNRPGGFSELCHPADSRTVWAAEPHAGQNVVLTARWEQRVWQDVFLGQEGLWLLLLTVSEPEKQKALPQVLAKGERKFHKWGSCISSVQSGVNTMEGFGDGTPVLMPELRASIPAPRAPRRPFSFPQEILTGVPKGREADERAGASRLCSFCGCLFINLPHQPSCRDACRSLI